MIGRQRVRSITQGGLTLGRLWRAAIRRAAAVPDNLTYKVTAGPTSENWARIDEYKDSHRGERCFILGNGPSLIRTDPSRINTGYTFGVNRIYLAFEEFAFRPDYYICMNELVIDQIAEAIEGLNMPRFLNWRGRRLFKEDVGVMYVRESYRAHFSKDLTAGIWGGATVTYSALQIAYYMGFQQVILIGVDHHYTTTGTPHTTRVASGPDLDHFHPRYFEDGFRWQLPDLATSEFAYRIAKKEYDADGREIIDATAGGKLGIFRKVDFESIVD